MPYMALPMTAIQKSYNDEETAKRNSPIREHAENSMIANLIPFVSIKRPAGMQNKILGKE